jgi:hypothetical protein
MDPISAAKLMPWGLLAQGGKAAVKALLDLKPEERLLYITHEQFGDEAGLSRKEMYAWLEEDELGDWVVGVVQGTTAGEPAVMHLAELISLQLDEAVNERKPELAEEMATLMVMIGPRMVNELPDAVAHIAKRLDLIMEALPTGESTETEINSAEALVRGPLVQVGMEASAARARELADGGNNRAAAETFLKIATALEESGLGVVAESYLQLAGELFGSSGETDAAFEAFLKVAEEQVARGAGSASLAIGRLEKALPVDRAWEAEALRARLDFSADPEGAREALREAAETGESRRHLANYTDLLAITGAHEELLSATSDHATSNPRDEPDLMLQLDRLDALSASGSPDADTAWAQLLRNLDVGSEVVWRGIAWQRRGAQLAREGDVSRSHDAYQHAMAVFAQLPGYQEQAADAFYSLQVASLLNAQLPPDSELRALAYAQSGAADTPIGMADRLAKIGMEQRLANKLPDALRNYALAAARHRRAGSLQGQVEIAGMLGELMAEAGVPSTAVSHLIIAGKAKEAAELAAGADAGDLVSALQPGGARWERGAKLAVIAAVGERLPPEFLSDIGPWIREEAGGEPDSFFAPQPAHQARLALAAVALALPADQQDPTWQILRRELARGISAMDASRKAGSALEHATVFGLTDATAELVSAFAADPYNSRVGIEWLAERVGQDTNARDALLNAEPKTPVLAVLELAGLVSADDDLRQAADSIADGLAKASNVEKTEGQVSIGFGRNYAIEGIAARGASEGVRGRAARRLIELLNDPEDSEMNRAAAAQALFNLAGSIPASEAGELVTKLLPAATGDYPLSQWDENLDHPLSRMRVSTHTRSALWAAALEALGRIVEVTASIDDQVCAEPINIAIQRGPDSVVAAAANTLSRLPDLPSPVPLEVLLGHSDVFVRIAALRCWKTRSAAPLNGPLLDALRADASSGVRHMLVVMAAEEGNLDELKRFADLDTHVIVRRTAEMKLRESGEPALTPA